MIHRRGRVAVLLAVVLAAALLPSRAFAANLYGLIDTGELYRSTNGGITWAPLGTLPVHDAVALSARLAASDLFLASRSGSIERSLDAGVSWTPVGTVAASDVVDLCIHPDGSILLLTASGSLLRSTNLGVSFAPIAALGAGNFASLCVSTGTLGIRLYALTRTGEVYESVDGGLTWSPRAAIPVSSAVRIRAMIDDLYVLTEEGDVFRSGNAAVTWTPVGTLSQVGMCGLVRNGTLLVAATREGEVATSSNGAAWSWKGSMNQITLTALASDETAQSGVGAPGPAVALLVGPPFPNPSPGDVAFTIRLTAGSTVRVSLFDAAGRLTATREPEWLDPGDHTVSWSPEASSGGLPRGGAPADGVYFLRIETGQGAVFRRWVRID